MINEDNKNGYFILLASMFKIKESVLEIFTQEYCIYMKYVINRFRHHITITCHYFQLILKMDIDLCRMKYTVYKYHQK